MKILILIAYLFIIPIGEYSGIVVKVKDGDTIIVYRDTYPVTCRLVGIDAPELSQSNGLAAKKALEKIILNGKVNVVSYDYDIYGRELVNIYYNGLWINKEMVLTGNAYVYRKYCKEPELFEAEGHAIKNRLGVWKLSNNDIKPWEFRRYNTYKQTSYVK